MCDVCSVFGFWVGKLFFFILWENKEGNMVAASWFMILCGVIANEVRI